MDSDQMETATTDPTRSDARPKLTPEELRVLGCLVEKELTTPDQYPLTLNALVLACNQKSNRDPVVDLDEGTVSQAVTSAKTKGLVRFVHPSHGRSALRYAHMMAEATGLSERQLALVAVLILRGPQTPGELRARTDRMTEFSDLSDLERELDRLRGLDPPAVERLQRRPGQKEDRFIHLFGEGFEPSQGSTERYSPDVHSIDRHVSSGRDLGAEVDELRAVLEELRSEMAELRRQLGD